MAAIDDEAWSGPFNATAPEPVTNAQFSRALGRALHRPAVLPVPAIALRALYGQMAEIVTEGQRAIPRARMQLEHSALSTLSTPGPRRVDEWRAARRRRCWDGRLTTKFVTDARRA